MLLSLHVKNLALIDEEEVLFEEGLNILTGETGAGKSIVIGSVNLALGAKADKDLIRTGAEYALVELVFQVNKEQEKLLKGLDYFPEEDGTLIIQRKIMPSRSVCKVCGETVGTKQLREIAEILIDIHGQHEHQTLLQKKKHKEILDDFAGGRAFDLKNKIRENYKELVSLQKELEEMAGDETAREKEAALLGFEVKEIEEASLVSGEDEELEQLYRKMVNSRKIKEAVSDAYRMTGYEIGEGAGEFLGRALRELKNVSSFDHDLSELEAQLQDIDNLLNDFNRAISGYMEELEFDGEDFAKTEERLNLVNHLKSKYGNNIEEILAYKAQGEERLNLLENYETYRLETVQRIESARGDLQELCGQLSDVRQKKAKELGKLLKQALSELNFEQVRFEIQVRPCPEMLASDGYDDVEFMISTNKGEKLKPLSQVASGGELSRIMLAFKTVLADKDDIQTLIFDEIDTGISGKTAWRVSEKMGILGRNHQIICITHLPQIAAMSDVHFLIEKNAKKDRTVTTIRKISEEDDLRELARMLGGAEITEAALQNAKEMKELARNTKQY
ncbi:DNA repair protein RecN [Lachnospiraceae bacterium]|nr:DNA repair protein RecN [Lachnospiraceae bacterium]